MLNHKNKTGTLILFVVLATIVFAIGSSPSKVFADATAPGSGAGEQQNAECVADNGVLGFDSATNHSSCTTCNKSSECITKDSTNGKVLPLYYPAACKVAGGSYVGTIVNGTNTVRCQMPDKSFADIKLQSGALPMSSGTIQSTSSEVNPDQGKLTADCKDTNITKDNCGIVAYVVKAIDVLSALVGIIIVGIITFRGVQYIFSRENAQETGKAKEGIRDAIFALVYYLLIMSFLQWAIPGGVF